MFYGLRTQIVAWPPLTFVSVHSRAKSMRHTKIHLVLALQTLVLNRFWSSRASKMKHTRPSILQNATNIVSNKKLPRNLKKHILNILHYTLAMLATPESSHFGNLGPLGHAPWHYTAPSIETVGATYFLFDLEVCVLCRGL